jgi:hypothetical protein
VEDLGKSGDFLKNLKKFVRKLEKAVGRRSFYREAAG